MQMNTDLGWSANSDYLVGAQDAVLGSILTSSNSDFPAQPLPVIPSGIPADVVAGGLPVIQLTRPATGVPVATIYAASDMPNTYIMAGADKYVYGVSISSGAKVFLMSDSPTVGGQTTINLSGPITAGTFTMYCERSRYAYGSYATNFLNMPSTGASRAQAAADYLATNLVVNGNVFKKQYAGVGVFCRVKFRNAIGTLLDTIIGISSERDFAKYYSNPALSGFEADGFQVEGFQFTMFYLVNEAVNSVTSNLPFIDLSAYGGPITSSTLFRGIAGPSYANIRANETVDPYNPFDNSGEGGGETDPDPEDDDIEEPPLPTLSFAATGFCRIYRADEISLSELASYMWTDSTFLATLINHAIQLIENPMDAIISLCLVPVEPPAFQVAQAEPVSVMYIPTPAAMWPVINQFARVDCGTLQLNGMYGSALDYNPYTKVTCFLPYVGFVDLDTDEVMGKTLGVVYRIDVVTGVCVAMISVDGDILYQFSGHCSMSMPLSSADFSTVIAALLQTSKLVAGSAAMAAGAPEIGGMLLGAPPVSEGGKTVTVTTEDRFSPTTGRPLKPKTSTSETTSTPAKLGAGELIKRQTSNTVGAIMNSKFGVVRSGGFSGNSGYLGVRRPFIVVKQPRIANPEQYGQYNGRPAMIYIKLSECTGYTEVQSVQLTGIPATNAELSEIATLLKGGVIL